MTVKRQETMEEQRIQFVTAIIAKEKGFPQDILGMPWYNSLGELTTKANGEFFKAPTQSLLAKFLREKYKIDIVITFSEFSRTYGYKIYYIENVKTECINHRYDKYDIFELVFEIAIQEALKSIKINNLNNENNT